MLEDSTERADKSAVNRDDIRRQISGIVRRVMRAQPGESKKERTNQAAAVLGLKPSRAEDLLRMEVRRPPADEHINILVRFELWLTGEADRLLIAAQRAQEDRKKARHDRETLGAHPDFSGPTHGPDSGEPGNPG